MSLRLRLAAVISLHHESCRLTGHSAPHGHSGPGGWLCWLLQLHHLEHVLYSKENQEADETSWFLSSSAQKWHITSTYGPMAKISDLASMSREESLKNVESMCSVWGTLFLPRCIYNTFSNQKGEEMT